MSDISLGPWVAIYAGAFFTVLVGGALLLLAAVVGVLRVRAGSWAQRASHFAAGPLACLGLALAYWVVAEFVDRPTLSWLGEQFVVVPFIGFGVAVATTTVLEVRRARRKRQARTSAAKRRH